MIIYNAFHSIGLFSVFDSDVIANADVYTGGFSAKFGGRISSVMDIKTRDGNKKKIQGRVGVSPFGAKLTLEGPVEKAWAVWRRDFVHSVIEAQLLGANIESSVRLRQ
jgi:hypothetical protein